MPERAQAPHLTIGIRVLVLLTMAATATKLIFSHAGVSLWAGLDLCPFKVATGCPCPYCGCSRAASALVSGRLAESLRHNPMMLVWAGYAALWVLAALRPALLERLPGLRRLDVFLLLLGVSWLAKLVVGAAWAGGAG